MKAKKKDSYAQVEYMNWIRLIRSENIGARTFNQLIALYGNATKAIENVEVLAKNGGLKRKIMLAHDEAISTEIDKAQRYGARLLCSFEPEYPALLKSITDAPPVITVIGSLPEFSNNGAYEAIAVVGARNASLNGSNFARDISYELVTNNIVIVSGLARGIDTYAHKGALASSSNLKCKTVAVIAGGIDHIYPSENERLYWQIREQGAVVAELPFGCAPLAKHFPQRNRIIAGMAAATAVIEAARKSGSLITAELAATYKRKVFAVPGSPMDARAGGANYLLRNGASMLESVHDVLNFFSNKVSSLHENRNTGFTGTAHSLPDEALLAKHRKMLHDSLSYSPTSIDAIIRELLIPLNVLNFLLLEMEIAGKIERHFGNKVSLVQESTKLKNS